MLGEGNNFPSTPLGKKDHLIKSNLTTSDAIARRTHTVKLRLTKLELIELRARSNEVALAVFIREILFVNSAASSKQYQRKKPTCDEKNDGANAVAREIAKIGNNLNQIAKSVNLCMKNNNSLDLVIVATRLCSIWEEINVLQNIQSRSR